MDWTAEQIAVIRKVLRSDQVQSEIGAENWDLTEAEEGVLWEIINGDPDK